MWATCIQWDSPYFSVKLLLLLTSFTHFIFWPLARILMNGYNLPPHCVKKGKSVYYRASLELLTSCHHLKRMMNGDCRPREKLRKKCHGFLAHTCVHRNGRNNLRSFRFRFAIGRRHVACSGPQLVRLSEFVVAHLALLTPVDINKWMKEERKWKGKREGNEKTKKKKGMWRRT